MDPQPLSELLSAEHKDNPALQDFTDTDSLAKAFIDTKQMVGGMIRIPGEDASSDDIKTFRDKLFASNLGVMMEPDFDDADSTTAFYTKMGRPEEAGGYSEVEGMPKERFELMSGFAHEAGITDKQFSAVMGKILEADGSVATAMSATRDEGIGSLKTEWGEAYVEKVARAQRLAEATKAPAGLIKAISEGKVDAASLRWLDSIAASIGGEGTQLKDDLGGVSQDTKDELMAKRDELTRKLQSERLPQAEHTRLVAKLVEYNERIVAGG